MYAQQAASQAADPFVALGTVQLPQARAASRWVSLPLPPKARTRVGKLLLRALAPAARPGSSTGHPAAPSPVAPASAPDTLLQMHVRAVAASADAPACLTQTQQSHTLRSCFQGHALYRRDGSYSACGYDQDTADGSRRLRLWFGGGIPEGPASDNVYYAETTQGLPLLGTAPPRRLLLHDSRGALWPYNRSPGYGGDPSVIRLDNGTHWMYFSGLGIDTRNATGRNTSRPLWNQIYRAASHDDGATWTLSPPWPVVAAASGGAAGYGSGSPSVVCVNGTFFLWYYSQTEVPTRGGTYRRASPDGLHFPGPARSMDDDYGGIDIKYLGHGRGFAFTGYTTPGGVYVAFSLDGLAGPGAGAVSHIAQDPRGYLSHNPGWASGDARGWLTNTSAVALTFGVSLAPFGKAEYRTRQLAWTEVSWDEGGA